MNLFQSNFQMIPMFCKDLAVSSPRSIYGFLLYMLLVEDVMQLDKNFFDKRNCIVAGTELKIFDLHFLGGYMLAYTLQEVVLICCQSYEDFPVHLKALMSNHNW